MRLQPGAGRARGHGVRSSVRETHRAASQCPLHASHGRVTMMGVDCAMDCPPPRTTRCRAMTTLVPGAIAASRWHGRGVARCMTSPLAWPEMLGFLGRQTALAGPLPSCDRVIANPEVESATECRPDANRSAILDRNDSEKRNQTLHFAEEYQPCLAVR